MFEIHITVNALTEKEIPDFVAFCHTIDVKPIIIELEEGQVAQQPMISKVYSGLNKGEVHQKITGLKKEFGNSIYQINRIKVEVPLDFMDQGKPEFPEYKGGYFEWHGKVECDDFQNLKNKFIHYKVHLSRNSLKGKPNLRFLTFRGYANKNGFISAINKIKNRLDHENIKLVKEESEYCIYDSNKSIDQGWINTPEITDTNYLYLLAFEGFLRRASQVEGKFILKGSLLTRQCIGDKNQRMARDLDFVYGEYIDSENEASNLFSNWVTKVTETEVDDGIYFRSFKENDFWRGIDYAMHDDFPTTNTDLYCLVNGQVIEAMGLDISWNLPIDDEPVPVLYKPLQGEPFEVPCTVPVPLQISWKLHQSVVRPRAKDFVDVILLLEQNGLSEAEIKRMAWHFVKECKKDKIDPERICSYTDGKVSAFFKDRAKFILNDIQYYKPYQTTFGFNFDNELNLKYIELSFQLEKNYESIIDILVHFEKILLKNNVGNMVLKIMGEFENDEKLLSQTVNPVVVKKESKNVENEKKDLGKPWWKFW